MFSCKVVGSYVLLELKSVNQSECRFCDSYALNVISYSYIKHKTVMGSYV